MSLVRELEAAGSPASRYLATQITQRDNVAQRWRAAARGLADIPVAPPGGDFARMGDAFEICVGLDSAKQPPYPDLLASWPAQEIAQLLTLAGFAGPIEEARPGDESFDLWRRHARTDPLPDTKFFELCWDLAGWLSVFHKLRGGWTNEQLRQLVIDMRTRSPGLKTKAPQDRCLLPLWEAHVRHGRSLLAELGESGTVAPWLAGRFARADLVLGDTLLDVKVREQPAEHIDDWLNQVIGYALLDTEDHHGIRRIGIYLGLQSTLMICSLDELFGNQHTIERARAEFLAAVQPIIDKISSQRR